MKRTNLRVLWAAAAAVFAVLSVLTIRYAIIVRTIETRSELALIIVPFICLFILILIPITTASLKDLGRGGAIRRSFTVLRLVVALGGWVVAIAMVIFVSSFGSA
jgi:hypothetical protein